MWSGQVRLACIEFLFIAADVVLPLLLFIPLFCYNTGVLVLKMPQLLCSFKKKLVRTLIQMNFSLLSLYRWFVSSRFLSTFHSQNNLCHLRSRSNLIVVFFFHSFSVRNVTIFTIFFYSNHVCWSLVAYLFLCNIFNSYSFCSIRTCVCCRLDDSAISQVIERIVQSKCMKKKKNKNKKDKQIWLVEWATSNLLLTKWIFYVLNYAKIQSIHCQFRIQWK